jgi:hypothetical protein
MLLFRGADPVTPRRGPPVTLLVDASLVVSALIDTGSTGMWRNRYWPPGRSAHRI